MCGYYHMVDSGVSVCKTVSVSSSLTCSHFQVTKMWGTLLIVNILLVSLGLSHCTPTDPSLDKYPFGRYIFDQEEYSDYVEESLTEGLSFGEADLEDLEYFLPSNNNCDFIESSNLTKFMDNCVTLFNDLQNSIKDGSSDIKSKKKSLAEHIFYIPLKLHERISPVYIAEEAGKKITLNSTDPVIIPGKIAGLKNNIKKIVGYMYYCIYEKLGISKLETTDQLSTDVFNKLMYNVGSGLVKTSEGGTGAAKTFEGWFRGRRVQDVFYDGIITYTTKQPTVEGLEDILANLLNLNNDYEDAIHVMVNFFRYMNYCVNFPSKKNSKDDNDMSSGSGTDNDDDDDDDKNADLTEFLRLLKLPHIREAIARGNTDVIFPDNDNNNPSSGTAQTETNTNEQDHFRDDNKRQREQNSEDTSGDNDINKENKKQRRHLTSFENIYFFYKTLWTSFCTVSWHFILERFKYYYFEIFELLNHYIPEVLKCYTHYVILITTFSIIVYTALRFVLPKEEVKKMKKISIYFISLLGAIQISEIHSMSVGIDSPLPLRSVIIYILDTFIRPFLYMVQEALPEVLKPYAGAIILCIIHIVFYFTSSSKMWGKRTSKVDDMKKKVDNTEAEINIEMITSGENERKTATQKKNTGCKSTSNMINILLTATDTPITRGRSRSRTRETAK